MSKLAQTLGLTEFQTEIIATVRQFVEKEVIPSAPAPGLGEDTAGVLARLGLTAADIERLTNAKTIAC